MASVPTLSFVPAFGAQLYGRTEELALIASTLGDAPERGATLVLRGEPGIGKSSLLDRARELALDRGMRVLSTAGVEAESDLPYSALHRLVLPLLKDLGRLPAPQQAMLLSAFGMTEHGGGDLFLVALGTLGLLANEAATRPLLVTVDDMHWLDAASRDAIAFVGRRLDADPIVLLGAIREGYAAPLEVPERLLPPLTPEAASALLQARAPWLAPALRTRLLSEAAGNPLAIAELPLTIEQDAPILPISARLERAFAARLAEQPPDTRALLLVLAADVTCPLSELFAAGEQLTGEALSAGSLQPALDAHLISLTAAPAFRHPLVRSAVYQSATLEERQAAHAALARVAADQPDRRAQHRAAAAEGPDEGVAQDLEEFGRRALRRGAALEASAALARAAGLSTDPAARVRRLLAAAEPAFEAGRADVVKALVGEARRESLSERDIARAEWLSEIFHDGSGPGQGAAARVLHLVELSRRVDDGLAHALLFAAALRCWWGGSEDDVRARVVAAVEQLDGSIAQRAVTIATAHPLAHGVQVAQLIAAVPGPHDARTAYQLGMAGHAVGDYGASLRHFAVAADRLREQGRLALLTQAQVMRSVECVIVGDFAVGSAAADEAARLAADTGQPIWLAGATGSRAALAGLRGDIEAGRTLAAEALATLEATGSNAVLGWLQTVRGIIELSAGRYDEAYAELVRVFDPHDSAYHVRDQFMAVAYLADAAVGRGDVEQVRAVVERLGALAGASPLPGLRSGLEYARALIDNAYEAALSVPARPFDRARLQLAHGMWLRRRRRVIESRDPLRLARSGFDALNVPTWADRARRELRAAGETSTARTRQAWDDLSPQELQISQLAAAGLSNREIGQRLYLSHRTVATHLYHAFPKLGITSRSQLNGVLPAQAPTEGP